MRLVICDDQWLLLEAMATALAARGWVIEAATTTPGGAVAAVDLHDPDILLIDVSFPTGSGLDAVRELKEAPHRSCKVVLLTGRDDVEPLLEALELDVAGYIRKDQTIAAIAGQLERVANGETAIDPGLLRKLSRRSSAGAASPRSPLERLTARERAVLGLLADGLNTVEIMRSLDISHSTAGTHVQSILGKLGVHSRVQAVAVLHGVDGGAELVPAAERGRPR